ncbi:hypothetical protein EC912_102674 [Luteibacter rhizovicinus]|uniref:Virulence surface antigen n=1 Tax=Luteibacter rhizovicinus TaxID=242606 RepID=A0A4R3YY96_9GAMM|nr:hypothetical protein [Luteibacter rhizovicinus]TCV96323.1 hypothetical protein EC912_102674 [Luteibacter rhizovicinus]
MLVPITPTSRQYLEHTLRMLDAQSMGGLCQGASAHWMMDVMSGRLATFDLIKLPRALLYQRHYEALMNPDTAIRAVHAAIAYYLDRFRCTTSFETSARKIGGALNSPCNVAAMLGMDAPTGGSHSIVLFKAKSGRRFVYCSNAGIYEWACSPHNAIGVFLSEYNTRFGTNYDKISEAIISTTPHDLPVNAYA